MDRKKKVSIYYSGFMKYGGVLTHLHAIEQELKRSNWEVTVFTLDKLPLIIRYLPHFVKLIINLVSSPNGLYFKDRTTSYLYKILFNNSADLRIFEDVYLSWNSKIPSVTILHALWSDNLQSFKVNKKKKQALIGLEYKIINKIKHPIISVSKEYADYINNEHFSGKLKKKINYVELGIDQSKYKNLKNKESINKKSIVYTGNLDARKNVIFLLHIFKELVQKDMNYKLTLIGDGSERKKLEEFASKNNLDVIFLGSIIHEEVIKNLINHGIYLHTSTKESFSYSLLEAKLAGLKTCAYQNLHVPKEFIDIPMISFEINEWIQKIHNIEWKNNYIDCNKYTIERMTRLTIQIAS
jgi:glycosyltransferase involved in cell wall biosynthesis